MFINSKQLGLLLIYLVFPWIFCLAQDDTPENKLLKRLEKSTVTTEQMTLHNQLAKIYHSQDSVRAYRHALAALELAQTANNELEIGEAYKNLGMTDGYLGYSPKAIAWYDTAYYHFELAGDSSKLASVLNNVGRQLCNTGAFERAIAGYHEAEHWAAIHEEKLLLLVFKFNHAACLSDAFNAEAAVALCEATLPLAKELENWYVQSELYSLLGINYGDLEMFEKAEAAYTQAFACVPKALAPGTALGFTTNNPGMLATIFNNRGILYLDQQLYEQAYADFGKALELSKNEEVPLPNGEFYINMGLAAKALQQWDESLQYLEEGLLRLKKSDQIISIGKTYQYLAELHHNIGNGQKAYQYLKAAHQIQDSLLSVETEKNLQELNVKYETTKVKQELLESNSRIERQQYRFNLFRLGALGLLLLGIFGYWYYHSKQRNRLLEMQKRQVELQYGLLRAQMNPHFIFNALAAIQGFFVNQKLLQGNAFLGKFSSLIRRILDQSTLTLHSLQQELDTLQLYLDIEKERLEDQLDYTILVDEQVETSMIDLPPLIFQPFVENAIWHGIAPKQGKGHIWIDLQINPATDALQCTIKDDGVGLKTISSESKSEHNSKGISITRERLGDRGDVQIQANETEPGVTVQISILTH
ncbi:MAG: histidine kinase [Saprospiraceae bacterium]|nr:histidine kinase [Saprospiraceae bacterium]